MRSGVLREELKRQNMRVSRLHAKLFYQPLLESVGQPALGLSAGMTPEAAERQLAALGYEGPQSALTHLAALTSAGGRRGRVQQVLLPTLLDWLSDTPDPDAGLLAYRRISEELSEQRWYLSTLRDEGAVAKRLMQVLGTSAYVPELLMRAPEVIQLYADGPDGAQAARRRPRRGGAGAGRLGRPARRSGAGDRRRAHAAQAGTGADRVGRPAGHARGDRRVQGADVGVGGGAAGRAGRGDPGQHARRRCARAHRGDRDGPSRRRRAGLRVGRRRDVRLRTRRRACRCRRVGGGAVGGDHRRAGPHAAGHAERRPAAGGRRRAAARGPQRPAGAHAGLVRGVLRAVGATVGDSGAAAGALRRG